MKKYSLCKCKKKRKNDHVKICKDIDPFIVGILINGNNSKRDRRTGSGT